MIAFKCLVNGSIDSAARERVRSGLERIYFERFALSSKDLRVEFTEVKPGLWFTGGRPSEASMVLGTVPSGTTQAVRVEVMASVCRMFSDETGARYEDVMVVAADSRPAS